MHPSESVKKALTHSPEKDMYMIMTSRNESVTLGVEYFFGKIVVGYPGAPVRGKNWLKIEGK